MHRDVKSGAANGCVKMINSSIPLLSLWINPVYQDPDNKGARQGCACQDVNKGKFTPHGNLGQPCPKCGC